MSYAAQHNAIRTRFNTQWASATTIAWPNVDFDPPEEESWVRFSIEDAGALVASFGDPGNNTTRHSGLIIINVFSPLKKGDGAALALCDNVAAAFRGWSDATSGVKVRQAPFVRRVEAKQKWYQFNVLIPFERDSHF
jgi:hypothetical protein